MLLGNHSVNPKPQGGGLEAVEALRLRRLGIRALGLEFRGLQGQSFKRCWANLRAFRSLPWSPALQELRRVSRLCTGSQGLEYGIAVKKLE